MLSGVTVLANDYSKEEIRSATEINLRASRSRRNRLQTNELLDKGSQFYYDGEKVYAGIVIDKLIFPALVNGSRRIPGCIHNTEVIAGTYYKRQKEVVCELYNYAQQGKSILVQHTDASSISVENTGENTGGDKVDAANLPPSSQKTKRITRKSSRKRPSSKQVAKGGKAKSSANQGSASSILEVNGFRVSRLFGVRAGTWARVILPRSVSSSEIADIEIELIEDIPGIHKKIPVGTIFFASHNVNPSTQRLDMKVNLMVMPDGSEYKVTATIHSISRTSGLAGSVLTHSGKVASIAARKGFWEASKSSLSQESNLVGQLGGKVAEEVIDSQSRSLPQAPQYSVQVASQEGLIRFGRSF